MIDTHAHIDGEAFDGGRPEMLARAFEAGVEYIIIPAIEPKHFDRVITTAGIDDRIYCSIGVHPHNANDVDELVLQRVRSLSMNDKVVAIGEIGLDYYYDFSPRLTQIDAFRQQLRIARDRKLPVIIHNRESDDDLLKVIEEEQDGNLKGVLHCFSGSADTMNKALDLNLNLSFTGNITFKNTDLGDIVRQVPLDRVMIETDSPYMTPVPFRGKRNEPALVRHIAEKIAEYKSISLDEVISMTTKTAKSLFQIPIILLIFLLSVSLSSAQTGDEYEDTEVYDEEEFVEEDLLEEEFVHPYKKLIGIGPLIGANTIVETYLIDDNDVSYEGLVATGGSISYGGLYDFLVFEVAYIYSKNQKIADDHNRDLSPDIPEERAQLIKPNIHHVVELTAHWIANPYGRVNMFLTTGFTFFFNNRNGVQSNKLGVNAGVGFYFNIPVKSVGLFAIAAEVRLNFEFGTFDGFRYGKVIDGKREIIKSEISEFFSIPRVGILWFPDF